MRVQKLVEEKEKSFAEVVGELGPSVAETFETVLVDVFENQEEELRAFEGVNFMYKCKNGCVL